jgi:hypothetical protein
MDYPFWIVHRKSKKDGNLLNTELRASVASSEGEYSLAKFVFVFFVLSKPDIPGTPTVCSSADNATFGKSDREMGSSPSTGCPFRPDARNRYNVLEPYLPPRQNM